MKIKINKMSLKNFKGIKDLTVSFGFPVTDISGDNATGKTTIADAFYWLLFDKDSLGRSNFQIKTLDKDGKERHGLEHEVEGEFTVDEASLTLRKVYKEKWVKKKGESLKMMSGHTTDYFINEVPVKKGEYESKINQLINEDIFKLLSNPFHFPTLHWKDQREALMSLIDGLDDESILSSDAKLKPLIALLDGYSVDDYKKVVQSRRKKLNKEIETIPARISELTNQITIFDFKTLKSELKKAKEKLKEVNDKILDSSKLSEEEEKKKKEFYKFRSRMTEIEEQYAKEYRDKVSDYENEVYLVDRQLRELMRDIDELHNEKKHFERMVEKNQIKMDELREQWGVINARELELDENIGICPTCKRPFDEHEVKDKKELLIADFNTQKKKELAAIQEEGKELKLAVIEYQSSINDIINRLDKLNDEGAELSQKSQSLEDKPPKDDRAKKLEKNAEYQRLKDLVNDFEKPEDLINKASDIHLENEKNQVENEIERLQHKLAFEESNEKLRARIDELEAKEREYANQIAALEGEEELCNEFTRRKVSLLEEEINKHFEVVNFKLFDTQVNGGIVETCEATIDGVPYNSANRAAQINAGLDIIKTLSRHYDTYVPIFIDNREAVNRLIKLSTQIINLRVTTQSQLTVEAV